LLPDAQVRAALTQADHVAVKLDAVSCDRFRRINQPVPERDLDTIVSGILQFRQEYSGRLAIQTMVLSPWSEPEIEHYLAILHQIQPNEIQLNRPSRPRPLTRRLEARGNTLPEPVPAGFHKLASVRSSYLPALAARLQTATEIPIRYNPVA
jgi:wyosine [tRNA(Phe)-imidazoG37] synthetase (radical SAM superfamily)